MRYGVRMAHLGSGFFVRQMILRAFVLLHLSLLLGFGSLRSLGVIGVATLTLLIRASGGGGLGGFTAAGSLIGAAAILKA